MYMDRSQIGNAIARRLREQADDLDVMWRASVPFRHFVLDNLLPEPDVLSLAKGFPGQDKLMLRSTIRERKRVGVDISKYDRGVADHLFAFQQPEVVEAVAEITKLGEIEPDPTLYASGISTMCKGDFLNPHIDNSHDGDAKRYRVLNLLFYVSAGWDRDNGGNLELWDQRLRHNHTVLSKFNRLVVMETHQTSWHSVSKVLVDSPRLCLSNYYFSCTSPAATDYSNVTTFAGRPEEPFKRIVLRMDGIARNLIGKAFPGLTRRTRHRIRKP